jgi:hypothetical protein
MANGHAHTVVFIAQTDDLDANRAVFGGGTTTVDTGRERWWGQSSASTGRWGAKAINDALVTTDSISGSATDLLPHVFYWYGDGSHISLSIDNDAADPNAAACNIGTTSLTRVGFMCNGDKTPDSFFKGRVGVLLEYDRELSAPELTQLQDYFANGLWFDPDPPLPQPTIDPSIIDVVGIMGQSNAAGHGDDPPDFPAGLFMWSDIPTGSATVPVALDTYDVGAGPQHGVELKLAALIASVGLTPFMFKVAQGGTGLETIWLPAGTGNFDHYAVPEWATCLAHLQATEYPGKTFRFHFIWIQGEDEARLDPSDSRVTNYAADLATLIGRVRSAVSLNWGSDCHFYITRIKTIPGTWPAQAAIQAQQDLAAATITNCHVFNSDTWPVFASDVHYNSSGFTKMAQAIAPVLLGTLP